MGRNTLAELGHYEYRLQRAKQMSSGAVGEDRNQKDSPSISSELNLMLLSVLLTAMKS